MGMKDTVCGSPEDRRRKEKAGIDDSSSPDYNLTKGRLL